MFELKNNREFVSYKCAYCGQEQSKVFGSNDLESIVDKCGKCGKYYFVKITKEISVDVRKIEGEEED